MMSRSSRRFTCGLFNLYRPTDWLEKVGMEEIYLINRATRIIKRRDQLSITFRGNVNSIGPFIPFTLFFVTILLSYGLYALDAMKPTIEIFALFITSFISILITLTESTLKYEINIRKSDLFLITTRLNIKLMERIPTRQIISIEKVMKSGQIGNSVIYRPHICIHEASTKHTIPVTLDEDHVDDIIKLMQEFIAGSNA
jgi:hypothetical protein